MKKITLILSFLLAMSANAQINVFEDFESHSLSVAPSGWVTSGSFYDEVFVADYLPCAGDQALISNLYFFTTSTYAETPNYTGASAAEALISFNLKILDYDWDEPVVGNFGYVNVSYSTDNGANWVLLGTIDQMNVNTGYECETYQYNIADGVLTSGGNLKVRFDFTWLSGDFNVYIDDFTIQQIPDVSSLDCATNIMANSGSYCTNGKVRLSWDAVMDAVGYKIYLGTAPNTYDMVNGLTVLSTSYTYDGVSEGETYYYKIVPTTTIIDAEDCAENSFTTLENPCPCQPTNFYNSDYIDELTTTGAQVNISNLSGFDQGMYSDFTHLPFVAYAGDEITFNFDYTYDSYSYITMWINWNDDSVFDETERVVPQHLMDGFTHSFTYTVPSDATPGTYLMRIRTMYTYSSIPEELTPCDQYNYGETEDYLIEIQANPTAGVSSLDLSQLKVYPNPTTDILHIQYKDMITVVEVYDITGRLLFVRNTKDTAVVVDTDMLSAGNYLLKIKTVTNEQSTVNFIKK